VTSRRIFLAGLLAGAPAALARSTGAAQDSRISGPHPPQDNRPEQPVPTTPGIPQPDKRMLEHNQNEIRRDVDRLCELAADLRAEVAATDPNVTFSVTLIKKAQEIEKLAKNIKARAKA
jgi:hypothetical protein